MRIPRHARDDTPSHSDLPQSRLNKKPRTPSPRPGVRNASPANPSIAKPASWVTALVRLNDSNSDFILPLDWIRKLQNHGADRPFTVFGSSVIGCSAEGLVSMKNARENENRL